MAEPFTFSTPASHPQTPAPKEPVVATIIPPAPSPWQFGLKALLGLMAVCCVQFALMNYLTVVGGLIAGLVVCLAALTVLMVIAVCLIGRRSPLMEKLDLRNAAEITAHAVKMGWYSPG